MHFLLADGTTAQYKTGSLPGVHPLFSPRLGFNYDLQSRHSTQVRGGTGIFTGRPAYVWISNQIGNTGVLTGFISQKATTAYPFNPNPNAYAPPSSSITGGPPASFELALTDPNFKFPQVWRSNLALDQRLPGGLLGTVEFLYTKDVNGIGYVNVNLPAAQTKFTGPDTRPRWTSNQLYANVSDATVLTNEGLGHASSLSFVLERPVSSGLYAKVGYTYSVSQNTVDPGSIAFGTWTGIATSGYSNNPGLGYSANSAKDRIFAALTYSRDYFNIGSTAVSIFLDGHTGGNTSYVFAGDMNGDGVRGNDLIYIPTTDTAQMNFVPSTVGTGANQVTYTRQQQQQAWEAFIQQDDYLKSHRGQYAQRNAVFYPMVWRADFSVAQALGKAFGRDMNRLQVRLDILNVTNLINHNWGLSSMSSIPSSGTGVAPLVFVGVDATGAPTYKLQTIGTSLISSSFQKAAGLNDVWRMSLGVRYMLN
jgi:hypothetical protein